MPRHLIEKKPTKMMASMGKYPTRVHQWVNLCKKIRAAASTRGLSGILSLSLVINNPKMLISKELALKVNWAKTIMCSL